MEERVYDLKEGVTPTHSKIDNGIKVSIKRASHIVEEVVVSLLSKIIPNGSMEGLLKGVHIGTQIISKGFCDEVAFVDQIPNPFIFECQEVLV
uniref:Uncharacterized protein n=1 Tax=Cucumis sativus TaxID=3659 RepID=A0A0A0LT38_CUCSA